MGDKSSEDEFDVAVNNPKDATAELELEPKPKEAYRAVNSTGNDGLIKPQKWATKVYLLPILVPCVI